MSLDADDVRAIVEQVQDIVERSERRTGAMIEGVKTDVMSRLSGLDGRVGSVEREAAERRGAERERDRAAAVTPDGLIVKPRDDVEQGQASRWAMNAGKVVGAIALLISTLVGAYATARGVPGP